MTSLVTVLLTDPPRASILPWYFSLSIFPERTNFMFFRGSRAEVEVLNIKINYHLPELPVIRLTPDPPCSRLKPEP